VLAHETDNLKARKYWNQLKRRLSLEGSQLVTSCHQLKLPATDGKQRLTDVASAETHLRLVQSVPSPKAGPIKLMACAYCVRRFWKKKEQFSDVDIR
jgi:DNA-damage-inducible protein D